MINLNKFWNWLKDEETGERILRLEGVICGDDFLSWLFDLDTPKKFREELNSETGDVVVWLNSEGGDYFAASQIYTMLRDYRDGKVKIKIEALAASAASVIAMAGDTVEISPIGMLMIHNPWTSTCGDAEEMETTARFLSDVKESIINAYEQKTKLPREQLSQMMNDETWLHAQKAVELGFADKILFSENQPTEEFKAGMSTRRQVMNCISNAFKAKREVGNQIKKISAASRRKNLKNFFGGK